MREEIVAVLESVRPESDFIGSENFQNDGLLDSFDMIVLVAGLEDRFKVKIPGELIVQHNFCTIDAIESLVTDLLAG